VQFVRWIFKRKTKQNKINRFEVEKSWYQQAGNKPGTGRSECSTSKRPINSKDSGDTAWWHIFRIQQLGKLGMGMWTVFCGILHISSENCYGLTHLGYKTKPVSQEKWVARL
jgi:hypothetical protein